jgi:hypothetical protein
VPAAAVRLESDAALLARFPHAGAQCGLVGRQRGGLARALRALPDLAPAGTAQRRRTVILRGSDAMPVRLRAGSVLSGP